MTSKVQEEFLALCNVRHRKGSAFTPRQQGLGERGHQLMMTSHLLLMNEVAMAFPQEWPVMLPALEYLYDTSPQGSHGLSAHDISCGYALLKDSDTLSDAAVCRGDGRRRLPVH